MRIHFDHQVFSLQNAGGASRYHYELLRYLSTVPDVEASLFLGLNRTIYPFRELATDRTTVIGVPTPLDRGTVRYAVNELLETLITPWSGKFDIYHPTYFRRLPAVRANRVVVNVHDCTYEEFPHLFSDSPSVIRSRRALYAKADTLICSTEATRKRLLDFHSIAAAQTRVIHLGLTNLPRSRKTAEELRARMRRQFLLYVGVRNFHKNFAALLQAFHDSRLFQDFDLLALGGGPFTVAEKAAISSRGLARSVTCIPAVDDELLSEAYAAATLFVYPSLSEGFGMPPLEAMAAGCPVATSRVTAMPEVCQDAPFYFDPYDVGSIASALLQGVTAGDERSCAIAKGKCVAARYSWEQCGAETLAAYRECQ